MSRLLTTDVPEAPAGPFWSYAGGIPRPKILKEWDDQLSTPRRAKPVVSGQSMGTSKRIFKPMFWGVFSKSR